MTHAECEIVANAGVQLREIAERLHVPASTAWAEWYDLVKRMDAAALSISEVYGQLSALPLENASPVAALRGLFAEYGAPLSHVDDTGQQWTARWVRA